MLSEPVKLRLIRVAGDMAISICENGTLPVTLDALLKNFEQAYGRLQAIAIDQALHEPKPRHVETST
ncbi:MAG: hypothetical protein HYX96_03575 [Chloroflexi bacterium]|nr:hypothetical protein [Chloroflexota bacterium]